MSKADNLASLLDTAGIIDSADIGTGAITAAKLNIGQLGGRRNFIINGAMEVWQRGTTGFGHNEYSADRWVEVTNSTDSLDISLFELPSGGQTGLPTLFTHTMKCALTAGGTASALNDLRQRVENPKRFMGQTVTLSYYIKASTACSIASRRLSFTNVTNAPNTSNLPDLNVTTSWQRVVDTVTLNSSSSAVFSSISFLDVVLSLPVNQTADVYITGVQLELGDTATPFEHRSYGEELALCQRYYETSGIGDAGDYEHSRIQANEAIAYIPPPVRYKVTKRALPTVIIYGIGGASGNLNLNGSNQPPTAIFQQGLNQFNLYKSVNAGSLNYIVEYDWTANAEL